MRDQHRLNEKYELDTRHIITLSFVGLVVVGSAFVLGVMVGKKLQSQTEVAPRPDLLSVLDQKTEAIDSMQRDASLTFQDELTKAMPKPPPEPKPEPVVVAKPVAVEPEPSPAVAAAVAPPPAARVETLVKADVPKSDEVATRIASTKDAGALREALARGAQRPTEATVDGTWTLQLSAYQDKAEADRFASGLRERGYAPFVVEVTIPGKGAWYRVRMGRFPTREAAGRYLGDFKRETQIDAFVTSAN